MTRQGILDALVKFVAEQLGVEASQITEETSFEHDLDADSLDLVEMIMEIEDRFGIKIDDEDARKMKTVGNTLDYLENRQPSDGYVLKDED